MACKKGGRGGITLTQAATVHAHTGAVQARCVSLKMCATAGVGATAAPQVHANNAAARFRLYILRARGV